MPMFKIVPDEQELAEIERDLQFYPATSERLSRLSPAQVEAFNRDGYIKGVPVYTTEEINNYLRDIWSIKISHFSIPHKFYLSNRGKEYSENQTEQNKLHGQYHETPSQKTKVSHHTTPRSFW